MLKKKKMARTSTTRNRLYLLERVDDPKGYDYYDSMVVCAHTTNAARDIGPQFIDSDNWPSKETRQRYIKVTVLGFARRGIKRGTVLCASYNAG